MANLVKVCMNRSRRIQGNILITIGLLLIAAALILTARNLITDRNAGNSSNDIVNQIHRTVYDELDLEAYDPTAVGKIPDYILHPDMELPIGVFNGIECVGILQMPSIDKEFAVVGELTYDNLNYAPCRYSGSPYMHNLVIAAHNFYSHFTNIRDLQIGDKVIFIDMVGNVFPYTVEYTEVLQPTDTEKMINSEWDLSLFTCTFDSRSRYTVRCLSDNTDATVVDIG